MCWPLSKDSKIEDVLVVSLTNVGDVVMTTTVIDELLISYPNVRLTVVVGSKAAGIFSGHPRISTIIYEKHRGFGYDARFYSQLSSNDYDAVIDLRQSLLPLLFPGCPRTPLFAQAYQGPMVEKHLVRLRSIMPWAQMPREPLAIVPMPVTLPFAEYIVLAPGAADSAKRWPIENFNGLINALTAKGRRVVIVGDQKDQQLVNSHIDLSENSAVSLAGKTSLRQLAFVLACSKLAIVHDSGIMHLASYFKVPQVVLWGPTDFEKYKPWRGESRVVNKGPDMSRIGKEDILEAMQALL